MAQIFLTIHWPGIIMIFGEYVKTCDEDAPYDMMADGAGFCMILILVWTIPLYGGYNNTLVHATKAGETEWPNPNCLPDTESLFGK